MPQLASDATNTTKIAAGDAGDAGDGYHGWQLNGSLPVDKVRVMRVMPAMFPTLRVILPGHKLVVQLETSPASPASPAKPRRPPGGCSGMDAGGGGSGEMKMLGDGEPKCAMRNSELDKRLWEVAEIRQRLAEAATTLRRMPMPKHGKPPGFTTAWPDVVYDWLAFGWYPSRTPHIPPTPWEISRLDETLGWIHLLTRDQRLILWARANHWSWRKLEELDELERDGRGRREKQLRNISHDAEYRILNYLNGTPQRAVIPLSAATKRSHPG